MILFTEYFGENITVDAQLLYQFVRGITAADQPLTNLMMTFWTNFAHTG